MKILTSDPVSISDYVNSKNKRYSFPQLRWSNFSKRQFGLENALRVSIANVEKSLNGREQELREWVKHNLKALDQFVNVSQSNPYQIDSNPNSRLNETNPSEESSPIQIDKMMLSKETISQIGRELSLLTQRTVSTALQEFKKNNDDELSRLAKRDALLQGLYHTVKEECLSEDGLNEDRECMNEKLKNDLIDAIDDQTRQRLEHRLLGWAKSLTSDDEKKGRKRKQSFAVVETKQMTQESITQSVVDTIKEVVDDVVWHLSQSQEQRGETNDKNNQKVLPKNGQKLLNEQQPPNLQWGLSCFDFSLASSSSWENWKNAENKSKQQNKEADSNQNILHKQGLLVRGRHSQESIEHGPTKLTKKGRKRGDSNTKEVGLSASVWDKFNPWKKNSNTKSESLNADSEMDTNGFLSEKVRKGKSNWDHVARALSSGSRERLNEYISSLKAHTGYWSSKTFAKFFVYEIIRWEKEKKD